MSAIQRFHWTKVFQLFGRQYIRTWMILGLHVIMFMYSLFYIVYVTSHSFTSVFGTLQASGIECFCENSCQPLAINFSCRKLHLDVWNGSECLAGYFVLIETNNVLMQWWKDKLKSNVIAVLFCFLIILLVN